MKHIIALTLCLVSNITLFAGPHWDLTVDNKENKFFKVRVFFESTDIVGGGHRTIEVNPGEEKTVAGASSFIFATCYGRMEVTILVPQADGTFKDGAKFKYINRAHQCEDQKISFTVQAPKRSEDPEYVPTQGYLIMHYFPAQKNTQITYTEAQTPGLVFTF